MDFFAITSQEALERISRQCPRAMKTYIQCLNRADKHGRIHFSKELITVDMSESLTTFRNDIKALARADLLEWSPLDSGITIQLANYEPE